jgi:hypothetical protein
MGYYNAGYCFDTVQLAAEDFAARYQPSGFNSNGEPMVTSVAYIAGAFDGNPVGMGQFMVTTSIATLGGGQVVKGGTAVPTASNSMLQVDFLLCTAGTQRQTPLETFLYYQPTQQDIDAISILFIAFPMFFYLIGFAIREIINIFKHH